jgi:hypothetical protein
MSRSLEKSSLAKEGMFQGSKWISIPVLLDAFELREVSLLRGTLHPLGVLISENEAEISWETFCREYETWVRKICSGETLEHADLKKLPACAWTRDQDAVYLEELKEQTYLLRARKPVVQVHSHFFRYSPLDNQFRSKTFGPDSIFWGLQFSYPLVMQEPKSKQIGPVDKQLQNSVLFSDLRKWMREHTRSTPFLIGGEKKSASIRIGKNAGAWIGKHLGLRKQNLEVCL